MRVIVNIPDIKEDYFMLGEIKMPNDGNKFGEIAVNAFKHGKPLPEIHGRIIDENNVLVYLKEKIRELEESDKKEIAKEIKKISKGIRKIKEIIKEKGEEK